MIDFNGIYKDKEELVLPWSNKIIQNGYEVSQYVLMRDHRPLFVEEHYLKIISHMRILRMEIPMSYTPDLFYGVILKYCKKLPEPNGVLKLSFYELDPSNDIAYTIELIEPKVNDTIVMDLYNDFYIQEGKHRFVNTHFDRLYELSSRFAQDQEVDACFILNNNKQLTDSNLGSIFCIKDQIVSTPSLNSGTPDLVSRAKMIELINKDDKYELVEEENTPFALQKQDAVFLFSFKNGLIPVKQYRKKSYEVALCDYFENLFDQSISLVE